MPALDKILLTTSREPTAKIRTFCNDFARMIPNVVRVNRGKMGNDEIAEKALEQDAEKVVIVDRWHGGPGIIRFFKAEESGLVSIPPVVHVSGIKLIRELGAPKVKPAVSLVILPSETSQEILKLAGALSKFFDIPVLLMGNPFEAGSTVMSLSREKAGRIMITFLSESKREVGPRISVSDTEW